MERGVFSKPLNRFSLSVVHTEEALVRTVDALRESFQALTRLVDQEVRRSEA